MPIYEYYCDDCQKSFEVFVRSIHTPVAPVCPYCGGTHVEKEVTAASTLGTSSISLTTTGTSCAPSG